MSNPVVFIERDNVLMADPGYIGGADAVKLLPGVELAIKSLRQAGMKIVVVTNQPGVARGLMTEEALEATHARLRQILAEKAARIDAIYYCPDHPDGSVDRYARESDSRMPQPGLLRRAAEEMGLDLGQGWLVGATPAAIGAGQHARCHTVRIKLPETHIAHDTESANEEYQADHHARNLVDAARVIMREAPKAQAKPVPAETPTEPPAETSTDAPARETSAPAEAQAASETPPTAERPARPQTPGERPATPEPAEAEPTPAEEVAAVVTQRKAADFKESTDDESPAQGENDPDRQVRQEILRYVRQMVLQQETHDFSLTNVVGGIAQMFAGLCLLLGVIMFIGYDDVPRGMYWVLVGILLQTTSLTFFVMGRNHHA